MSDTTAGLIIDFRPLPAGDTLTPPADRIVSGQPVQLLQNVYSDPDQRFHVGQWRSSAGAWRVRYSEYEFCHLLRGSVRLEGDDGSSRTFKTGDSFLIAKGFSGIWRTLEDCEKLYAIYEPGPEEPPA